MEQKAIVYLKNCALLDAANDIEICGALSDDLLEDESVQRQVADIIREFVQQRLDEAR